MATFLAKDHPVTPVSDQMSKFPMPKESGFNSLKQLVWVTDALDLFNNDATTEEIIDIGRLISHLDIINQEFVLSNMNIMTRLLRSYTYASINESDVFIMSSLLKKLYSICIYYQYKGIKVNMPVELIKRKVKLQRSLIILFRRNDKYVGNP